MLITTPNWLSYIVATNKPIFTPEQCKSIIELGKKQVIEKGEVGTITTKRLDKKTRISNISWIPFNLALPMYQTIEQVLSDINLNHFMFDVKITEPAQYTEYNKGGFYNWHSDMVTQYKKENISTIRKISMTCLLSDPSEFSGGDLIFSKEDKVNKLQQGQAVFFASFLPHMVTKVTKGTRRSLVMWFGGTPFK